MVFFWIFSFRNYSTLIVVVGRLHSMLFFLFVCLACSLCEQRKCASNRLVFGFEFVHYVILVHLVIHAWNVDVFFCFFLSFSPFPINSIKIPKLISIFLFADHRMHFLSVLRIVWCWRKLFSGLLNSEYWIPHFSHSLSNSHRVPYTTNSSNATVRK